jgi:hypothetical protein
MGYWIARSSRAMTRKRKKVRGLVPREGVDALTDAERQNGIAKMSEKFREMGSEVDVDKTEG